MTWVMMVLIPINVRANQGYDFASRKFVVEMPTLTINDSNAHNDSLSFQDHRYNNYSVSTYFIQDDNQSGIWKSIQGDVTLALNGTDITISKQITHYLNNIKETSEFNVTIQEFQNGAFGIRLLESSALQGYVVGTDTADITETDVDGWYVSKGGDGSDTIDGEALTGSITAWGLAGNDVLTGGDQLDILYGGAGQDQLSGGAGRDLLFGDNGLLTDTDTDSDLIAGGADGDIIQGGTGNDTLFADSERDFESALNETQDASSSKDFINGGAGDDTITGSGGNDLLSGAKGNDLISGGAGNDFIFGDADYRTGDLNWSFSYRWGTFFTENIIDYSASSGVGRDTLYGGAGSDTIVGGHGEDRLFGGSGNDTMHGGSGNDVLEGGAGSDLLYGNKGHDRLIGDAGSDKYYFGGWYPDSPSTGDIGFDVVKDTGGASDQIRISTRSRLSDITFTQQESDLLIGISSQDGITVEDWFTSDQYKIESFYFGRERATLDLSDIEARTSYTSLLVTESISDQVAEHGRDFTLSIPTNTFSGPSPETHTITATLSDGSSLPSWLTFDSSTNTFSGVADVSGGASLDIVITAANELGQSVNEQFILDVEVTNLPPAVISPLQDMEVEEDQVFSFTVPEGTFSDPDISAGDTLSLEAMLVNGEPLPAWLTFDPLTATFSGMPENEHVGALEVRVMASDSYGETAHDSFVLTVHNVNDTPLLNSATPDQFILEDQPFTLELATGMFSDPDIIHGDTLSITTTLKDGSPLPAWLSFDESTRTFSGTPGNGDVGSLGVVITATDLTGESVSDEFDIQIQNVNDAPHIVRPVTNQQTLEDQNLVLNVGDGIFDDDDRMHGDLLTLSSKLENGEPLPSWLVFDSLNGFFTGVPANSDVGLYSVVVTATDASGEGVSSPFTLEVVNVNDAPVLVIPLQDGVAVQGQAYEYVIPAQTFADDDLVNGDSLYLSATQSDGFPLPEWLSFDPVTQTFSGTPSAEDTGLLVISVTATDSEGVAVSDDYSVLIQANSKIEQTGSKNNDLLTGSISGDQLIGLGDDDLLYGGGGDDALKGGHGSDVMYGGDGDDSLKGGHGHDTHIGGLGDDRLSDVSGDDKYVFGYGDGHDVIDDKAGSDQLQFTVGVNPDDLWLSRNGDDLTVSLLDSADQITISNWYKNPGDAQIETFQAGEGSLLINSQVDQLVQAMAVYSEPSSGDFNPSQVIRGEVHEIIVTSWQSA